ncbi:MAG: efflux RND transporter periplasmic adaptor subunit [Longimicrobiales bacterium]
MSRPKLLIPVALLLIVALVAAVFFFRDRSDSSDGLMASGTVETTEADLGFSMAGRVESVLVREGDAVTANQDVARLSVAELTARREAALAQVQAAQALLDELQQGARAPERGRVRAAVAAARARMDETAREAERGRALFEGGAISREARDQSETAHRVARAQYDQTQHEAALVDGGARIERIHAQTALVQQAKAAVEQVQANLDLSVLHAPFAGVVTVKHREAGETVSPGLPVVTIMNAADRWVRIYVHEDEIGRVHIGQAATITADTDPDKSYAGRVTFIASQAEFTPRNVQTSAERVKLVYAVKVAITGDAKGDLKSGVPADVRVNTGTPVTSGQ